MKSRIIVNISMAISYSSLLIVYFSIGNSCWRIGFILAYGISISGYLVARRSYKISDEKSIGSAKRAKRTGLVFLVLWTILLPMLALSSLTNERDIAALKKGVQARSAEERNFLIYGTYSDNLDELLKIDPQLGNNPSITFEFLYASSSGYTFYSQHKDCGKKHLFEKKNLFDEIE